MSTAPNAPARVLKNSYVRTQRQWRAKKRKQAKAILKAYEAYRQGCFYTPGYPDVQHDLGNILKELVRSHSYKNWR